MKVVKRAFFALCLLVFGTIAGTVESRAAPSPARGAGLWSTAASLIAGREAHTATLLPSGNVLVAGGTDGRGTALASAEVYVPRANQWAHAASMTTTRLDHTATLLSNGKVLVAGGLDGPIPSNSLASAEVYDPATDRWSAVAPMTTSRSRHTATLLRDGRVLVVGGLSVSLRAAGLSVGRPSDAEVYDPKTNRWSPTGAMALYRRDQTATPLQDGRVLVAGSQDDVTFNWTETYNAGIDEWTQSARMASGRSGHTASLLNDGDVLVMGGVSQGPNSPPIELTSAEVYHPATNRWSAVASMAQVHIGATATLLRDGRVLVVGGTGRPELYDPTTNRWSLTGASMDRYRQTATRLNDGRVLIAGGYGVRSLSTVIQYDPAGVAPVPQQPIDARVAAALLLVALATLASSIPAVRRRLKALRPDPNAEEWITS